MKARLPLSSTVIRWYPAAVLFLTLYLVYGSVAESGSLLLPSEPLASLAVFTVCLGIIFFLEALEVSVISLYSREEIPLSKKSMTDFLKGRQLLLILIVFLTAEASASPQSSLPFVGVTMPGVLALVLFRWGFLGSFLVLWIGQLGGKVMASMNPEAIQKMLPSRLFLHLGIFLGGTPLVTATDWFVQHAAAALRLELHPGESFAPNAYFDCAINACSYGESDEYGELTEE